MSKKYFYILLIIIILVSLYATNPSKSEFADFAETNIATYVSYSGVTSNSYLDNLLGIIAGKVAEKTVDIVYTRDDYYLFSVYKIEGVNSEYKYLGIFKKFFALKFDLDADIINSKFKDIIELFSNEDVLEEDHYMIYPIKLTENSDIIVEITPTNSNPFEIFLFDEENYEKWENFMDGKKANDIKAFWQINIDNEFNKSTTFSDGMYYLVIDNTDHGKIVPPMNFANDPCTYKVKISIK